MQLPRLLDVNIGRPHKCKGGILESQSPDLVFTYPPDGKAVITCKCSNSPLDVVAVVALNAMQMIAEDEWRPGNEDDSGESENSEDAVQDCASLF